MKSMKSDEEVAMMVNKNMDDFIVKNTLNIQDISGINPFTFFIP